jgi:hypothetical protein
MNPSHLFPFSAFKDPRLTGRPKSLQETMSAFFASGKRETNGGIVFTHGQQWTEQRRSANKHLYIITLFTNK